MPEEWLSRWGESIRLMRQGRGMSQGDLAKACDVTRATVSRWENGKVTIKDEHKLKVAGVLGVDVRVLFPLVRAA